MSFVGVDTGASSTRYITEQGKIRILPNNMVEIDMDQRVDLEPYSDEVENALDVIIEKEEESDIFPVRVLMGQMANRFSATNTRPSVIANKHTQKINYISTILAVAVSKLTQNIENDISLYSALPPVEVRMAKDVLSKRLVGSYKVTFPKYGNAVVKFNITDTNCFEESFMAILAYYFEMSGKIRQDALKFSKGNVMSMDIGASTTDLAVVSDMKYLEKSGQTYKTGGNIAREFIANTVRAQFGYDITDEQAEVVMSEGRLQMGNTYVDMSEAVADAKREFAAQITTQIQGYFRMVNIPIQSIRAIVVSGGGSMHSEYVKENGETVITSDPISRYITDELNKIVPGVEVVSFTENPRLANIIGLFIRASIDVNKKKMKQMKERKAQEVEQQAI